MTLIVMIKYDFICVHHNHLRYLRSNIRILDLFPNIPAKRQRGVFKLWTHVTQKVKNSLAMAQSSQYLRKERGLQKLVNIILALIKNINKRTLNNFQARYEKKIINDFFNSANFFLCEHGELCVKQNLKLFIYEFKNMPA